MKKKHIIWMSINLLLLATGIYCLVLTEEHYKRPATILSKSYSAHEHKSRMYFDYYFIVRWQDRDKKISTINVRGESYHTYKVGDEISSKQLTEFSENTKNNLGYNIFFITVIILYIISTVFRILTFIFEEF